MTVYVATVVLGRKEWVKLLPNPESVQRFRDFWEDRGALVYIEKIGKVR